MFSNSKQMTIELEEQTDLEYPKPTIHHVVIDCSTVAYLDDAGVQGIRQVRNLVTIVCS